MNGVDGDEISLQLNNSNFRDHLDLIFNFRDHLLKEYYPIEEVLVSGAYKKNFVKELLVEFLSLKYSR